jgi:hypothetical protein
MPFQIVPVTKPLDVSQALRFTVESKPGFPCRVSLEDAEIGEEVLLLNYEHLPVNTPYRASHAIYVRPDAMPAHLEVNEIPTMLRSRLLSIRAFDHEGMMRGADVAEGEQCVHVIEQLFADRRVAYLHLHFAKAGCYAARVERVPVE